VMKRILPVSPHGEYPNAIAELYYFSKWRWLRLFESNGFEVIQVAGNGLFYSGYGLFPRMALSVRRRLARVLGSACHVFVMQVKPLVEASSGEVGASDFGRSRSQDSTLPAARIGDAPVSTGASCQR